MHDTITGVDLAKDEIQVCVCKRNKVLFNKRMTPIDFSAWLAKSKPAVIVFEACSTSNYWKQLAIQQGHDAKLISAKLVSSVRQNQKTDKNDALAIAQAAQLPDVVFISGKTREQQELQTLVRLRELAVKRKVASNNQLIAILLEFNIRVTPQKGGLNGVIQDLLEDAGNGFSDIFREAVHKAREQYLACIDLIKQYDTLIEKAANQQRDCKKLQAIEGVGPMNAVNLYLTLGCNDLGEFKRGRDAAACIGLTPMQHSSGGKTKLGSVSKHLKNHSVRSCLVNGAMSVINHAIKRKAKTQKDLWVQDLVARRGKKCAAVALANKTVRTAYSLLKNGTEYKAEILPA